MSDSAATRRCRTFGSPPTERNQVPSKPDNSDPRLQALTAERKLELQLEDIRWMARVQQHDTDAADALLCEDNTDGRRTPDSELQRDNSQLSAAIRDITLDDDPRSDGIDVWVRFDGWAYRLVRLEEHSEITRADRPGTGNWLALILEVNHTSPTEWRPFADSHYMDATVTDVSEVVTYKYDIEASRHLTRELRQSGEPVSPIVRPGETNRVALVFDVPADSGPLVFSTHNYEEKMSPAIVITR